MSTSTLDDDDIIPHNPSQPIHPRPLIRELLRTRYAASGAIFLIEGIESVLTSDTGRWRTLRVLLGDGELSIQGLLSVGLHRYVDTGEVGVGTYVRLEEFVMEDRRVEVEGGEVSSGGGGSGNARCQGEGSARVTKSVSSEDRKGKEKVRKTRRMVCLIVESMVPVGWNRRLVAMAEEWDAADAVKAAAQKSTPWTPSRKSLAAESESRGDEFGTQEEEQVLPKTRVENQGTNGALDQAYEAKSSPNRKAADNLALETLADMDDDDDDFEVMPISQERSTQRRREVNNSLNSSPPRQASNTFTYNRQRVSSDQHRQEDSPTKQPPPRPPSTQYASLLTQPNQQSASTTTLPQPASFLPKPPIKITPLKSIPTLPYRQNWSVNVLAVISAISPVEPSGLPPYSQRQARLTDPSTPKHVLLTVFLDPEEFSPAIGSVVLLLGVKNHMFDGGSLKKYASDRPKSGGGGFGVGRLLSEAGKAGRGLIEGRDSWWLDDPVELAWCDVAGLQRWWVDSISFADEIDAQQ